MPLHALGRMVGGCIFAVALGACQPAVAACLTGAHQSVVIHVKRLNRDIVFDIPAPYPVEVFGHDSFVIAFSYPGFAPRPVDAGTSGPAARIIVYGSAVGEALADFKLKHPPTTYLRTENGIELHQGTLGAGSIVNYYFFRDADGNPVLFDDMGRIAVGYLYTRRMPEGADLRGVVSKKIGNAFRGFDADVTGFIKNMICEKK
jgi:hypothetical protein